MPGKIFVRERSSVEEGDQRPRFAIVGVQGEGIQFLKTHVRRSELDAIAKAIGADVVILPRGAGEHGRGPASGVGRKEPEGGGGGHGHGHGHREHEAD
jgi:hypothetical protein